MQPAIKRGILAAMTAILVSAPLVLKAVEINLCQVQCVCIFWTTLAGGGGYAEVRCPPDQLSGWSSGGGTADGGDGSWAGTGTTKPAPSPLPGNPLSPTTSTTVNSAKSTAKVKLRGNKVTDEGSGKNMWEPTECTDLFLNSPLGRSGVDLLSNYVVFRDGMGVKDAQGVDQCATGIPAWTTCCTHDPVVYICSNTFNQLSTTDRVVTVIHETMHVGGQQEDKDGSVGPGDPPNAGQISDAVRNACY